MTAQIAALAVAFLWPGLWACLGVWRIARLETTVEDQRRRLARLEHDFRTPAEHLVVPRPPTRPRVSICHTDTTDAMGETWRMPGTPGPGRVVLR
jgi:hypothetical protein